MASINITNIVKEFRPADMQAYITSLANKDLVYKSYFPSKFTPYLTWEQLEAEFGYTVAADIMAINSPVPLKGRNMPNTIGGDIPKVGVGREKNEKHILNYKQLQQRLAAGSLSAGNAAAAIVDWMYEDTLFVINGVNGKMELLAKEAASTGQVTLTVANNSGGVVTPVTVGFGVPSGNIVNSNTNWWAGSSVAKPISDIKAAKAAALAKGYKYSWITMDEPTFQQMILSDEVIKFVAGSLAVMLSASVPDVTLDALNARLTANLLPPIRIWSSVVNVESKGGTQTASTGWKLGNVVFSVESEMGSTQWTEGADSIVDPALEQAVRSQSDFITVKAFAQTNPSLITTMATAMAVPVLKNTNQHYILQTKQS